MNSEILTNSLKRINKIKQVNELLDKIKSEVKLDLLYIF